MTFGEKLRESRITLKMTQKQLADKIGAKHNSVSDWENNKNKPDSDTIELLCSVLNITPNYLLNANCEEFSSFEKELIKKYNALDKHGKKMVDFTLQEEWERTISERNTETSKNADSIYSITKNESVLLNAAHARTDINIPDGIDSSENNIMDDENF